MLSSRMLMNKVVGGSSQRIVVLAFIGHSNQQGNNPGLGTGGNITSSDIAPDAHILEWTNETISSGGNGYAGNADRMIQAEEPLHTPGSDGTRTGISAAMPAAKAILANLTSNDLVVIWNGAVGGTTYVAPDGASGLIRWGAGGDLLLNAIDRLAALKAYLASTYPGATVEWNICGLGTENDNTTPFSTEFAAVNGAIDAIVDGAGLPDVAVIATRISPAWMSTSNPKNALDSALIHVRNVRAAVVIDTPDGPYDPDSSNIHFNADAQVVIGGRIAGAYELARSRVATPFDPHVDWVDDLGVTPYAACSLFRRLKSTQTYAFRAFRASDSATLDIGYDSAGFVDWAAAEAFWAPSGVVEDGYVDKLYDASGNARDFAQIGSNTRPKIAQSGIVQMRRGLPMLGGNNAALLASFDAGTSGEFAVMAEMKNSNNRAIFSSRGMGLYRITGGPWMATAHSPGTVTAGFTVTDDVHAVIARPVSGAYAVEVDGSAQTLTSATGSTMSYVGVTTLLGRETTSGGALSMLTDSRLTEVIWNAAQWSTTDRDLVRAVLVDQGQTDPYV